MNFHKFNNVFITKIVPAINNILIVVCIINITSFIISIVIFKIYFVFFMRKDCPLLRNMALVIALVLLDLAVKGLELTLNLGYENCNNVSNNLTKKYW